MRSDFGIITACDANYFPGLLMLHRSVQESLSCPVVCYDVGLTPLQMTQANQVANLEIVPLPKDPWIARIQEVMTLAPPLAKPNKRIWPLWICPLLIEHAPYRDVIWMDCDLIVLRNLDQLFALVAQGPVFTPENKAPHLTPNRSELYDLLPISRPFDPLVPTVNAGVSGWRKDRDGAAIKAYFYPVKRALEDLHVRSAISWHDQGALIWAIQSLGLEDRVAKSVVWNLCVDHTPIAAQPIPWNGIFLDLARATVPHANILHWNGRAPPWFDATSRQGLI